MNLSDRILTEPGRLAVGGAPEGFDAALIGALARAARQPVLVVARDRSRLLALCEAVRFFAPDLDVLEFPAWDCLPYDRVSPDPDLVSRRMATLSRLANLDASKGAVVVTTVNAAIQKVPPRDVVRDSSFRAQTGRPLDIAALTAFLARNGYARAGTVVEPGEYAIRGGIIDIYAPGGDPVRLDLFGDTLESVRTFDPESQRTMGTLRGLDLIPASEILLDPDSIQRFRTGYVGRFGAVTHDDPLYEAVSAGRKHPGMEHFLPLFYERLDTLFDYLPQALVAFEALAEDARETRLGTIEDYFRARSETRAGTFGAVEYRALPPDLLYLDAKAWDAALAGRKVRCLSPYPPPESKGAVDAGGRSGRDFGPERAQTGLNLFDALIAHVRGLQQSGKKVLLASYSIGSRDRLSAVLADHGLENPHMVENWGEAEALPKSAVGLIVLGIENGFETESLAIIGEQDVLGDRLIRRARRTRRAENFLREVSSLSPGDLVVHIDHGVGRYEGLQTLSVGGAPHDCLTLIYQGGDKLYLPVENIELLSRYGSDESDAALDKLGGSAWQARKARAKKRILEMAGELIRIAAERALRHVPALEPPHGGYDEFCARFPYEETEDQENAIRDVLDDMASGKPMDRLICGDVGFGKTEVALRAAFVAALDGKQVAVVTPTTVLARQHFETFSERFKGFPVRIAQLSRFASAKEASETRKGLEDGQVDIVVGTHALLSKAVKFKRLGLVIVDEEQHFGVKHKERLKQLRADVHVLTMTATPIPRTLQLALSGVRDLSIIATPPVDRLAVRTFVLPFDPVVVREAILREHYRGGQTFYVCPRIADLPDAEEFLKEHVPEVKAIVAHGQMPATELDDVMRAFYERRYGVLLCTTIIESGLDIPTANTMIVHRADRFGLAQLYQLRGRIGRSKARAFAYLTLAPRRQITANAEKRLRVLQTLDSLGAGFTLASHDLDIRGAGNLLGEEQSGHVREVGLELYQEMLEEAVASLKAGGALPETEEHWSPQINIGAAILIPETYVADLDARLGLYQRLASIEDPTEIEGFAAELIDRFGSLPAETENLLKIVGLKRLCRTAGIEKVDAGPKGATLTFRAGKFANPAGLVAFINSRRNQVKLRPEDHKLVFMQDWPDPRDRLKGAESLLRALADLITQSAAAA